MADTSTATQDPTQTRLMLQAVGEIARQVAAGDVPRESALTLARMMLDVVGVAGDASAVVPEFASAKPSAPTVE